MADYKNEKFELVSGCCIIDRETYKDIAHVYRGGIEWTPPNWQMQQAVSAFVGECAINGIVFPEKK